MEDVQRMTKQLDTKILQICSLKQLINKQVLFAQYSKKISKYIRVHLRSIIIEQLSNYNQFQLSIISQLRDAYKNQVTSIKTAYEQQIQQMKLQISRQYKVIGLMKQEVQDLMMLLNQQQMRSTDKFESFQQSSKQIEMKRYNNSQDLQIIQEETQRTLISSYRSQKRDFIKIQQKLDESYSQESIKSQNIQHPQQSQSVGLNELFSPDSSQCLKRYFIDQAPSENSQNKQKNNDQYNTIPVSVLSRVPYNQSISDNDFLADLTNIQSASQMDTNSYRQPKTKQFLQQFRKTFNQCLSTMSVSRKNSSKFNMKMIKNFQQKKQESFTQKKHQVTKNDMQVTFGKNKKKSQNSKSMFEKDKSKKSEDYSQIISSMLKDRDNGNKFLVGDKKIQLKFQGEKKDNLRDGSGILYYSNGLCYQGQFKKGLREGYGILKFNHIQIYNGDWKSDQLSGQGKIRNCAIINRKKTQNQSSSCLSKWISYCGEFKSNRFQGQGTLYLQAGQKFLGTFIGGIACGQGTLYKKNGDVETGLWRNNILTQTFS